MTTNGRQNNEIGEQSTPYPLAEGKRVNESRRRFGKSTLAVSGVIATLASRPVLGAEICKSPSGFLSGNLSSHGTPPTCMGRSPGYWVNHENWPIANRTTAKFSHVFTCDEGTPFASVTMLTLLTPQDYDKHNLARHLVAAYLNVKSGWSSFLTVETLQAMWNEWRTTGYFSPTAGVKWDGPQITSYIQGTYD